jgi:hypothetical protein
VREQPAGRKLTALRSLACGGCMARPAASLKTPGRAGTPRSFTCMALHLKHRFSCGKWSELCPPSFYACPSIVAHRHDTSKGGVSCRETERPHSEGEGDELRRQPPRFLRFRRHPADLGLTPQRMAANLARRCRMEGKTQPIAHSQHFLCV